MAETMAGISEEISFHKKEVQQMLSEKETLQHELESKAKDVKNRLAEEVSE